MDTYYSHKFKIFWILCIFKEKICTVKTNFVILFFADLNECEYGKYCDQNCKDVINGYNCTCQDGYILVNRSRCIVDPRKHVVMKWLLFVLQHCMNLHPIAVMCGVIISSTCESHSVDVIDNEWIIISMGFLLPGLKEPRLFIANQTTIQQLSRDGKELRQPSLITPQGTRILAFDLNVANNSVCWVWITWTSFIQINTYRYIHTHGESHGSVLGFIVQRSRCSDHR